MISKLNNKFYLSALVLLAVIASGLYLMSDSSVVSAQRGDLASRSGSKGSVKELRADMLAVALNFGSTSEYTVFGAKGVRGDGATVTGKSGTGSDEASLGESGSGVRSRSDLNKAFSMIRQLPCQEVGAELTSGTFGPGVYCAPSAALAGQMVLDAGGDSTGSFVFRIAGAMKSAEGFQMSLENGAKAGNVFFVADTASLGANGSVIGSVITRGAVEVGAGTSVKGRVASKEGEVILGGSSNIALADAYIQICKRALHDGIATTPPPAGNVAGNFDPYTFTSDVSDDQNSLRYKIFRFQINGGTIYEVPTGSCSGPILVVDGNNSIQELLDGYFTNRPDRGAADGSGTWFNRFRLVAVQASGYTQANGAPAPTGITATNLTTRTVTVSVAPSPSTNPLILTFTNTFAIPGVIEICKYSANLLTTTTGLATPEVGAGASTTVPVNDTDVSGFFDFTVNSNPGSVYTIPVGVCTGPIQVLTPTYPSFPPGSLWAEVFVTELAEPGFTLEAMSTNPANRQLVYSGFAGAGGTSPAFNLGIPNIQACILLESNGRQGTGSPTPGCTAFANAGGGYQSAMVNEGVTPADQTIFNFFNRTNPGIIKVCKIAGRGVPIGTRFDFEVRGRAVLPGSPTILPGNDVVRTVRVAAGPASQGGFCSIVTDDPDGAGALTEGGPATRFIAGTLALVTETAVVDDVAGAENGGFGDTNPPGDVDGPSTTPDTEVRVSRISVNGVNGTNVTGSVTVQGVTLGATTGNTADPNPDLFFPGSVNRRVIFRVGRGETVVTFVNRVFSPTNLKICKVAGTGVTVGTNYTFSFAIGTEGGLVPGQTNEPITVADVTIPAGDPAISSQGNCVLVNGPYESMAPGAIPLIGTFDVGSTIVITEGGTGGTVTITSPTATAGNFSQSGTRAGTLIFQYPGGFNEMIFVNSAGAPVSTGYSLSGRVMTPDGGGLRGASVILTKTDGTKVAVPTSSMGYYSFEGLPNETYTIGVSSRRYRFTTRNVDLSSSLANVDFTGIE